MAYSLVAHTATAAATTGTIDTTGADFIVVVLSDFAGTVPNGAITDSKGNVWSIVSSAFQGGTQQCCMYLSYPTSVGSGHTFTISGGNVPSLAVCAFSGSTPQSGVAISASSATAQPGTITLAQTVGLIVTGIAFNVTGATASIDASFTISDQVTTGAHEGVAMAYKIGTTGTLTPTWTITGGPSAVTSVMVAFTQSGGGGSAGGSYGFA